MGTDLMLEVSRRGQTAVYDLNWTFFTADSSWTADMEAMINCLRLSDSLQIITDADSPLLEKNLSCLGRRLSAMAFAGETFAVMEPIGIDDGHRIDIRRTMKEEAEQPAEKPVAGSASSEQNLILTMAIDDFLYLGRPVSTERMERTRIVKCMGNADVGYVWQACELIYAGYHKRRRIKMFGLESERQLATILNKHGLGLGMTFTPEERVRLVAKTGDYK